MRTQEREQYEQGSNGQSVPNKSVFNLTQLHIAVPSVLRKAVMCAECTPEVPTPSTDTARHLMNGRGAPAHPERLSAAPRPQLRTLP